MEHEKSMLGGQRKDPQVIVQGHKQQWGRYVNKEVAEKLNQTITQEEHTGIEVVIICMRDEVK